MKSTASPNVKSTALVPALPGKFTAVRYDRMVKAIAECETVDDCMEAQSVAEAMAVYYKQANDRVAFDQLRQIRLRAWRRMSEIIATVNVSKCATQKEMIDKVRKELGTDATACINDSRIMQLIKLAGVPAANFEKELDKCNGSMDMMYQLAHPAKIKERELAEESRLRWEKTRSDRDQADSVKSARDAAAAAAENERRADALIAAVKERGIVEADTVGLTLTPKAKSNLVAFSIMMDRKMHDQLRDAAHERRTTMWAIMREASNYWFVVNGYDKV